MRQLQLIGLYEVAQLAGVTPQAVSNWRKRRADFPKPLAELHMGPVWKAQDVEQWLVTNCYDKKPRQQANTGDNSPALQHTHMFTIYVNQQAAHYCGTWPSVKAYLLANGLRFAFVVKDGQQWNVHLTARNVLVKSAV